MKRNTTIFILALGLLAMAAATADHLDCAVAQQAPEAAAEPVVKPAENGNGQLTKAQEDELLAFLKKMGSRQYDVLVQLRDVNPATYQANARSWYYWMLSIKHHPEATQRAYVAQQEAYTTILRLVNNLRIAADGAQRSALQDQLRSAVTQLFDAQMDARETRLAVLRQQLAQLEKQIEAEKANRAQVISDNVRKWESLATQPAASAGGPVNVPPTQPK